jgi:3-hydroxymyristoyl/3-hydroxydecanoyl-(acyl carrier protein) dehydratase/acyl carrier protein
VALPNFTEADKETLKDALRRCSTETIESAIQYRETGNGALVPVIVRGIIERFLEPDTKPLMQGGDDSLKLFDDLGVDSLTMMEIVILVEETLCISVENEELRELRSIRDINGFIQEKLGFGDSKPEGDETGSYTFDAAAIAACMPHGEPFLFLNKANVDNKQAQGLYTISGEESFLKGHFKGRPVFPASLSLEALGQLAVLFLLKSESSVVGGTVKPESIYFTSCDGVRCHKMCVPGDKLEMAIKLKRLRHPMATFEGSIEVAGERVVYADEITLLFDY